MAAHIPLRKTTPVSVPSHSRLRLRPCFRCSSFKFLPRFPAPHPSPFPPSKAGPGADKERARWRSHAHRRRLVKSALFSSSAAFAAVTNPGRSARGGLLPWGRESTTTRTLPTFQQTAKTGGDGGQCLCAQMSQGGQPTSPTRYTFQVSHAGDGVRPIGLCRAPARILRALQVYSVGPFQRRRGRLVTVSTLYKGTVGRFR